MSQGTPLLLIGAGGFSREAVEAVRAVNAVRLTWDLLGYLDDDPQRLGTVISGAPVVGPIDAAHDHPDAKFVIGTGRPDNYASRHEIAERLGFADSRYATVIHPAATLGNTCSVGPGSVLLAHVDLTTDVMVGRHVAVMPQTVLTHDVRIDDYATIAAGVRISGSCHVAVGAYIGSGALIREGTTIGARALVGMGSVVTRDVPPDRLWYGAPARDMAPAPVSR